MAPSWRLAFLRSAQSTSGQSGGEVIGAYICHKTLRQGVRHNPETLKQKAGPVFVAFCGPISGVEIRPQNWSHQVAQQLKPCGKRDPIFGPQRLLFFSSWDQPAATFWSLTGDSFLADGSLFGCQVCRQGAVVFEFG